uniref:Uncharacterized protein n=1 Tax=Timema poppense TaxID=170557 RepID=A0A7R9DHH3_TIMPO|nr:unnamed protein product [Timema poppensis]
MGDERGGCCSSGSDTGRRELILATEPLHQVLDKQKIKMLSHLPELPRLDIEFSELLYTVPEGRKVASEHGYETRSAGFDPGLVPGFDATYQSLGLLVTVKRADFPNYNFSDNARKAKPGSWDTQLCRRGATDLHKA